MSLMSYVAPTISIQIHNILKIKNRWTVQVACMG